MITTHGWGGNGLISTMGWGGSGVVALVVSVLACPQIVDSIDMAPHLVDTDGGVRPQLVGADGLRPGIVDSKGRC